MEFMRVFPDAFYGVYGQVSNLSCSTEWFWFFLTLPLYRLLDMPYKLHLFFEPADIQYQNNHIRYD